MRREVPTRGRSIDDGLAARVHDPLWLLARQWQFGEFRHENAASPAWVEVETAHHVIDEWRRPDGDDWHRYDVSGAPLERLVEEHGGGPTPRLRLDGGLRFKRLLGAAGAAADLDAFVAHCPFPAVELAADAGDRRLRERLPDGAVLAVSLRRLADPATADAELDLLRAAGSVSASPEAINAVSAEWLAWWDANVTAVIDADEDCWDEHRMEHAVALRATSLPSVELRADGYAHGRLDWSSFDAVTVDDGGPEAPITSSQRSVPLPARFGGMPAARLWEMEDARFDPGSVDAGPIDLGRLMLVGYATVYGNDWFVVPMRLPVASLSRVIRCTARDVFDRPKDLPPLTVDQDGWNVFGLTAADVPLAPGQERPTSPWFLLAPSLPDALEGPPTDVVMLLRDEMANLAWAVEAVIADEQGRPLDRFEQWAARARPAPVETEFPRYAVVTEVPDHWFPLAPEQLADMKSVRLRLVPLARLENGAPVERLPIGSLLPSRDAWLYEEEVPRAGVQVVRTWQMARWHDGSRHVWQSRRKLTGRGEGSSGLRFDQVEEED